MDFTAAFRHAGAACICYSPGSTFLASISGDRPRTLLVRASSTLQVIRSWDFDTDIDTIEWSQDGSFILVTATDNQEDGVVFVVSLDPGKEANDGSDGDQGWVARIASGSEGLSSATWTPLSGPRSVVMFSQHQLRASIYSLVDQTISAVEGPKRNKLIRTAKRQDRFAMLLKGSDRDQLHILKCDRIAASSLRDSSPISKSLDQWQLDTSFTLATNDCTDAIWSPDGLHIAVWEGQLEYKLLVYTPLGRLRSTFVIEPMSDGDPVAKVPPLDTSLSASSPRQSTAGAQAHAKLRSSTLASSVSAKVKRDEEALAVAGGGLGLREVKWHPSGKYLALGGYDEQLRVLESQEWSEFYAYDLSRRTIHGQPDARSSGIYGSMRAWREPLNWLEETHARGIAPFETASLPISPAALRLDTSKPNPKLGVSWLDWSPEGNLIASFNERLPFTLFIHAFSGSESTTAPEQTYLLSVLQLSMPIKRVTWKPAHPGKLGIVCETQALYTWELLGNPADGGRLEQRAEATPIPIDDFRARDIRWSPDGQKILVMSDSTFCCAFETLDEPDVHAEGSTVSVDESY